MPTTVKPIRFERIPSWNKSKGVMIYAPIICIPSPHVHVPQHQWELQPQLFSRGQQIPTNNR